jgi:hypothetical protein
VHSQQHAAPLFLHYKPSSSSSSSSSSFGLELFLSRQPSEDARSFGAERLAAAAEDTTARFSSAVLE